MSESTNCHVVKSPEQFKELLSADLNRVSLINFWAPWAEPCKKMNDVVQELSKKHSGLLVLQVKCPLVTSDFLPTDMTFLFHSADSI